MSDSRPVGDSSGQRAGARCTERCSTFVGAVSRVDEAAVAAVVAAAAAAAVVWRLTWPEITASLWVRFNSVQGFEPPNDN